MKYQVGLTKNGTEVYVYLTGSKVEKRLARQPQLLTLANEVLATTNFYEPEVYMEYDLNRQIGYDFIIKTTANDSIFYAQLLKEDIYTRFIKNGEPVATSYLTVSLKRDEINSYELIDLWIGHIVPPRPGSPDETSASKNFWSNHAVILLDQIIQTQTLTKESPY